jgi:hypothetical protein
MAEGSITAPRQRSRRNTRNTRRTKKRRMKRRKKQKMMRLEMKKSKSKFLLSCYIVQADVLFSSCAKNAVPTQPTVTNLNPQPQKYDHRINLIKVLA